MDLTEMRRLNKLRTGMIAKFFNSPPELILRNVIGQKTTLLPVALNSTASSGYHAAVCTDVSKPLTIQTLPRQSLNRGQLRVAVQSAGLNFADILIAQGKYQYRSEVPFVPGREIFGNVIEVGDGVGSGITVGDKVAGFAELTGGFAEEIVIPSERVVKVWSDMPIPIGAAFCSSYGTAYMALKFKSKVQPGETVLVTAASGALGLATVDLAINVFKAKVIGAAGGATKCAVVREKGASAVIDYNAESVYDRVKEITKGRGVDVLIDMVGGKVFDESLRSLAFEGRAVVVGFTSGVIPTFSTNRLLLKSCSVMGMLFGRSLANAPQAFRETNAALCDLLRENKITPHVDKLFPLNKINDAYQYVLDRKSIGKVVIIMDEFAGL